MKPMNSIKRHAAALITMMALAATITLAHGDKKHVVGTVEKVNADSIVVKTAAGKSVEIKLVPTTIYVSRAGNEDKPAKQRDLVAGVRVVVHATPRGETLEANEVRFSAPGSPAATGAKPRS